MIDFIYTESYWINNEYVYWIPAGVYPNGDGGRNDTYDSQFLVLSSQLLVLNYKRFSLQANKFQ